MTLEPGDSQTWLQAVQLPFEDDLRPDRSVALGATVQVLRAGEVSPGNNLRTWPTYHAPEVPLSLSAPRPDQQLRVVWQAQRQQCAIQVRCADGSQPRGPLVALIFAVGHGKTIRQLHGGPDTFTTEWGAGTPMRVRVWVAGPGYVTALSEVVVP